MVHNVLKWIIHIFMLIQLVQIINYGQIFLKVIIMFSSIKKIILQIYQYIIHLIIRLQKYPKSKKQIKFPIKIRKFKIIKKKYHQFTS